MTTTELARAAERDITEAVNAAARAANKASFARWQLFDVHAQHDEDGDLMAYLSLNLGRFPVADGISGLAEVFRSMANHLEARSKLCGSQLEVGS